MCQSLGVVVVSRGGIIAQSPTRSSLPEQIPRALATPSVARDRLAIERLGQPQDALLNAALRRMLDQRVTGDPGGDDRLRFVRNLPEDRLADDLLGFLNADPFLDRVGTLAIDDDPDFLG